MINNWQKLEKDDLLSFEWVTLARDTNNFVELSGGVGFDIQDIDANGYIISTNGNRHFITENGNRLRLNSRIGDNDYVIDIHEIRVGEYTLIW